MVLYSRSEADQTYPLLDMMAECWGVVGSRKGLATEGQVGSRRIVHSGFSLSAQSVENLGAAAVGRVALALGLFGISDRISHHCYHVTRHIQLSDGRARFLGNFEEVKSNRLK